MLKPERGAPGSVRDTLSKERCVLTLRMMLLVCIKYTKILQQQNVEVSAKPGNDDKSLSVPSMCRELLVLGMAEDSRKWVRRAKG